MTESKKYIAYIRVSTREQELSGLGIGDQRYQIEKTVGKENIVETFLEIESGKKRNRRKLNKAIESCKEHGAVLVVAMLDRLGRNAAQLHTIREDLELLVVDRPSMTTLEFALHAGLAQDEAEKISKRTRASLAEKKRQGHKLGSPQNLTKEAREKGYRMRREAAKESRYNLKAYKIAKDLRNQGNSLRKIADKLNDYGEKRPRGGKFHASTVKKILEMYQGDS